MSLGSSVYAGDSHVRCHLGTHVTTLEFSREPLQTVASPSSDLSERSHLQAQHERYDRFYEKHRKLRRAFRFDVRYRCHRLKEVFTELGIETVSASVLDYGFGGGDLLASFPTSCRLTGVDISTSAVAAARADRRFAKFASSTFAAIPENDFESILPGPFDVVVSSHVLEHVHDDVKLLKTLYRRLKPGGILAIYVPIEEADYIPFHVRNYSVQSIATTVRNSGFELCHVEGSLQINGHLWKLLTIPSRRRWPIVGPAVDALRQATLSAIPYRMVRFLDRSLHLLGFGARQALVVARRPHL